MATLLSKTSYRASLLTFAVPNHRLISSPVSLVEAVQAAVQQIEEPRLRPIVATSASFAFQPRLLLAVLTYCYARQLYSGSEILKYLLQDEAFCRVCQSEFPNVHEIEAFRRQNRRIIECCLKAVLRFLAQQKVAAGFVTRLNETFIAEEAKRRMIMAAYMASLEKTHEHRPFVAISK